MTSTGAELTVQCSNTLFGNVPCIYKTNAVTSGNGYREQHYGRHSNRGR